MFFAAPVSSCSFSNVCLLRSDNSNLGSLWSGLHSVVAIVLPPFCSIPSTTKLLGNFGLLRSYRSERLGSWVSLSNYLELRELPLLRSSLISSLIELSILKWFIDNRLLAYFLNWSGVWNSGSFTCSLWDFSDPFEDLSFLNSSIYSGKSCITCPGVPRAFVSSALPASEVSIWRLTAW